MVIWAPAEVGQSYFCSLPPAIKRKKWTPGSALCQAFYVYFSMPSPQENKSPFSSCSLPWRKHSFKNGWTRAQLMMKINVTPKREVLIEYMGILAEARKAFQGFGSGI